ncbi:MAG: pyridoxamine 5'-phosphate oxidase family protein [Acidobacteria bacterium]|jgi:general stress protein 26|nr:pyridoxamine 5'-phosphate oxidase family protein [Acidobacteriota bacterium]
MKLPPPPQPEELRHLALAVIAADKFPMLATVDGDQPRVRPVSPVHSDGFTIYIASLRSSNKTAEIGPSAKVELCYLTGDHDQLRITGTARTVDDMAVKQRIWDTNPLLRAYLKSVDNPEFILYRVDPARLRYMREWALDYYDVPL